MFDYEAIKETSARWGISERRIQKLCGEDRIPGAMRIGHAWLIPKSAEKPKDMRIKNHKELEPHAETD